MSILAACQKAPEDTSSKTTTTGTNPTTTTTTEAPPKTEPPQTDPPKTDEPVTPDQFSPADLSNLLIWYDASTLELEDGDRVDRLENLASKDGKYPAVATVSRNVPTYKAESDISNKPGLVLNKQSSMKVEGSEGFTFDDFTILTVIRAKTVAGNNDHNQIFSKLANSGPWNHQWYFNINGASRMNSGWKDTNGAYMDFGSAAGDLSTNTNYILASSKQGKTSQLYINGTNVGALTSSVTTVAKNDQAVYIGSNGSTSQSMDGTVCEILLLEGEVTTTEIFNLLSYLAEKWSIPMDTSGFLPEGLKLTVAVGGDEIREFSLRQTSYKRTLAKGTAKAPEVTAVATVDGKEVACKVTQADSATGTATIALTDYDVSYTVKFSVLDRATVSLTPADVTEVKLLDGFWKDKVEMFASTTIHTSLDRFVQQGCLRNFEKVTRGSGSPENNPWLDGLLFETIAAAGDFLKVYDDPALKARVDDYIDVVYNASMSSKNGFLSTHAMLQKPGQYFDDHGQGVWYHECYNFGCMAEAAVHYYEATGEIKLLYVAARFAEFIADNYGYGKINMVPSHSLTEEALLEFYRLLRDTDGLTEQLETYNSKYPLDIDIEEYADLVKFWIENRGNSDNRVNNTLYGTYAQDHLYYFDQVVAAGHAVRANLFYTGMAAAGSEFENLTYLSTAQNLWTNIVNKQMYITGGVGATKTDEAYADDYDLPNDGYCETCAQVAMAFFGGYLSEKFEDSGYGDTIERLMYNGILGCVSQDGNDFYYTQPLNSNNHSRWEWHDCACCPPMFLKFYSTLANYIYSYDNDSIYVNQFVSSVLTHGGITLTMNTDMPWGGRTTLTLAGGDREVLIRIPEWATDGVSLKVNGKDTAIELRNGFAVVAAKDGDTIELVITMQAHRNYAHEKVLANKGRVAYSYGPLVYCLESTDNTTLPNVKNTDNGFKMMNGSDLTFAYEKDLLGGVVVLYTSATASDCTMYDVKLIPFYARANRGSSGAYVWMLEQK